jgi:hypothetical protein
MWSSIFLLDCRAYAPKKLSSVTQKDFCNTIPSRTDVASRACQVRKVPMSDTGVTLPIAALRTRRRRRPCRARSKLLSLIRGALSAGIVADIVLRPPVEVDIDDAAIGFMR